MPVLIVIPARVGSSRLPNKPLQTLGGAPLITRVAQRAGQVAGVQRVVVATDSTEVLKALEDSGTEGVLTAKELASGTDRVAAVSARAEFSDFDVVVNLQGDEPFFPLDAVAGSIERVRGGDDLGTAAAPLEPKDRDNPGVVKVVCNAQGRALYFSRLAIPFVRNEADIITGHWWHHLGIYAFSREVLLQIAKLPVSSLEKAEQLEQLRALEAGYTIGVAKLDHSVPGGIDTPEDLAAAQERWPAFAEALQ